jgi:hypothetical protein
VHPPGNDTPVETVANVLRCSQDRLDVDVPIHLTTDIDLDFIQLEHLQIEPNTGRIMESDMWKEKCYAVADLDELRRVVEALAPKQKGKKP